MNIQNNLRIALIVPAVLSLTFVVACAHKNVAKVVPPPPPPQVAPTASLVANPTTIQSGGQVTLTWRTQNADSITLEGIGAVSASGSRTVTAKTSTDYILTARGLGRTSDASARVTVLPPPAQTAAADEGLISQFNRLIKDVYFDYDNYDIRPDQQPAAEKAAAFLAAHSQLKVTIEGHCDDRGSEEYNLALGDSRANSLKSELLKTGVKQDQLKAISYGKERPFCSEDNEQCWQQNRRDHYVMAGQ